MRSNRVEAFSDGVFSIAATLLVLELHVPPHDGTTSLAAALLAQWPSYVVYLVSFFTIGIIWVNHHALFATVRRVDRTLLFLNLLLLAVVSAIPFPTAILGQYVNVAGDAPIAAAIYGVVMVVMSLAFSALWFHITRDDTLVVARLNPQRARAESRLFSVGLVFYVVGAAVAFISPTGSLILYGLTALFYVFPWLPASEQEPGLEASEE